MHETALTVDPRIADYYSPLGELQFRNLCLHTCIFERNPLYFNNLRSIGVAVHIRSQTDIVLHLPRTEIHNRFMEFVLSHQHHNYQIPRPIQLTVFRK